MISVGLYIYNQHYCNGIKMNSDFHLNPRLDQDSCWSTDLKLSKLILVNNSLCPWLVLVPRKNNLKEMIDLNKEERIILMEEISYLSEAMQQIFSPDKLNIASLGNIVEQLHIHVIARYKNDEAWPNPVFGYKRQEYNAMEMQNIINKLQEFF